MSNLQRKTRNLYYDSEEFWNRWHGPETIEDLEESLGVARQNIQKAAARRGFPPKTQARGPNYKYKERLK